MRHEESQMAEENDTHDQEASAKARRRCSVSWLSGDAGAQVLEFEGLCDGRTWRPYQTAVSHCGRQ